MIDLLIIVFLWIFTYHNCCNITLSFTVQKNVQEILAFVQNKGIHLFWNHIVCLMFTNTKWKAKKKSLGDWAIANCSQLHVMTLQKLVTAPLHYLSQRQDYFSLLGFIMEDIITQINREIIKLKLCVHCSDYLNIFKHVLFKTLSSKSLLQYKLKGLSSFKRRHNSPQLLKRWKVYAKCESEIWRW